MSEKKEKVVIAMSGGVDSSVCASLMVKEGFECVGMTMRLWKGPEVEETECSSQSCCGAESVEDARLVAEELKIPYYAINFKEEFWEKVVTRFADEYFAGRTPSPCILCNEKLKFNTLYKKAMEIGASKICTGHYARIAYDEESGRWLLMRGKDPKKDQTYFLFSMTQQQLSKTLFPVGEFTKEEIRKLAGVDNLVTANKPESQDICFIPDGDYAAFLERHFPEKTKTASGKIKHVSGEELGRHKGIHSVTIGQRRGLGVAFGQPLYVTGIDPQTNEVTVGSKQDASRQEFTIENVNWILREGKPGDCYQATIKIRSRSPEKPGKIYPLENGRARVVFDEPQLAITPGQASVFYVGDKVLGGGWIEAVSDS